MAKQQSGPPQKQADYPYPSRFGSHSSMLSTNRDTVPVGCVICIDEHGQYITEANRLDNGLADPNRYKTDRLTKLFANNKKEK